MMTEQKQVPQEILDSILRCRRILVAAHARPDGDAMGASLALAWALRSAGKDALVYNEDGVPDFLNFLALPGPVLSSPGQLPCDPDLIVCLDCGDRLRLGETIQPLLERIPTINIDHHLANPQFGTEANWVASDMSSTGEMAAMLIQALQVPLQGALAEALYVAIASDTGNFSYGNTTPNALKLTAEMLENGLPLSVLREKLENNWSERRLRLWGRLMRETRIMDEGKFAVVLITRELMQETGASREDTEGFVEQLRKVRGIRVALVLREEEKDYQIQTRASLRSSGKDNVRDVAAQFGGGGHRNAAGATIPLSAEKTLSVMHPYIKFVWNSI